MRTGRDGASHDAAAFYASISQLGKRRTGETGRDGSDPPGQEPGSGAGPCAFSRARPRPLGGRSRSNDPSREGCRASPGGTGQRSCLESHDANPSIVARAGGTVERCSGKSRSPSLSSIGSESIHPLRLRGGDLLAVV